MSYMGKGVTKAATLCLRHLVYEMASTMDDKVTYCHLQIQPHHNTGESNNLVIRVPHSELSSPGREVIKLYSC